MLRDVVEKNESAILENWIRLQLAATTYRRDLIDENRVRRDSAELLRMLSHALGAGDTADTLGPAWADLRHRLGALSADRARLGFTPSETATFVLSLKQPIFEVLRKLPGADPQKAADAIWSASTLLDELALLTFESFVNAREEVIDRQQQELLELSTPVVRLWHGVLALPLIGTLDSARTQIVMENLLQEIVTTGSGIAIIDITGVPTVDTLVAQHLLKTVAAARLMGADCIISGIRPQIAQTVVHLGVDLGNVTTKGSLADAFALALRRIGMAVTKADAKTDAVR